MIKVNMRDGRTVGFDLCAEEGLAAWRCSRASSSFQRSITGIAIHKDGWQHTLPLPLGAVRPDFDVDLILVRGEPVGESILFTAEDFTLKLTVYYTGVSRIDATKRVWRQTHVPRRTK